MASNEIYTEREQYAIDAHGRVAREQQQRIHRIAAPEATPPVPVEDDLLLPEELEVLWACEDEIRHGMAAYLRVAEALHTIQTKRLYREDYPTYAAYCTDKWNLTDRHARNMANAWEIALDIDPDPIGNAEQLPANERQARELKQVPKERRAEVWEAAVADAGGLEHVCAHDVKAARKRLIDTPAAEAVVEEAPVHGPEPAVEANVREVTVIDNDPANHAMRIINKYGAQYAVELAEHITNIIEEKGL